jgi:hypothetical protein
MRDAVLTQMPDTIRQLFCLILECCNPSNPASLFEAFKTDMAEDYEQKYKDRREFCDESKYGMVLLDIEQRLQEQNISSNNYNLLTVSKQIRQVCTDLDKELYIAQLPAVIRKEMLYDVKEQWNDFQADYEKLEGAQKIFVNRVISWIDNESAQVFFLDAIAGAGKMFCENILLSYCRAHSRIALGVATSGIAATLLKNGWTAQSRFHLPITTHENCTWNVTTTSEEAELFCKTKLIIWDEITMAHRHLIEALDTGLQDITKNHNAFGGKIIVFAGDFRQTLPIVKLGSRAQIVNACLK